MKEEIVAAMAIVSAATAMADTVNFDGEKPGTLPAGWVAGVTGSGKPSKDVSLADGFVEVKFKPIAGGEDQAGGVVWRWKDGDNYYVARANALENNVSLYHTTGGRR